MSIQLLLLLLNVYIWFHKKHYVSFLYVLQIFLRAECVAKGLLHLDLLLGLPAINPRLSFRLGQRTKVQRQLKIYGITTTIRQKNPISELL